MSITHTQPTVNKLVSCTQASPLIHSLIQTNTTLTHTQPTENVLVSCTQASPLTRGLREPKVQAKFWCLLETNCSCRRDWTARFSACLTRLSCSQTVAAVRGELSLVCVHVCLVMPVCGRTCLVMRVCVAGHCMHVCVCVYMYIEAEMYIHAYASANVCVHVCLKCICAYTYIPHICQYVYIYVYIYIYI
jgi:hypothetical protein